MRIVTIEHPAEVHVHEGQLVVEQEAGTACVPVGQVEILIACGPSIRISTMAQTMLAEAGVVTLLMGKNHLPKAIVIPMVANARMARVTAAQAALPAEVADRLWATIIQRKIENQARAIEQLGLGDAHQLWEFSQHVLSGDALNVEGQAAAWYFQMLHPGLNRRCDDPFNSVLNYGYAIVRAALARALVTSGFVPALGIHHHSQLNAFNLTDDLIEPCRPCVDLIAPSIVSSNAKLDAKQRHALRDVLYLRVLMGSRKVTVEVAIEEVADSLVRAARDCDPDELQLPILIAADYDRTLRD